MADGRRGSERTAAASRPAVGLVRGLGSGEEQEGQDSRVTTPAAEGPLWSRAGALPEAPNRRAPALATEEAIQTWSPPLSPGRPEASRTAPRCEGSSDKFRPGTSSAFM